MEYLRAINPRLQTIHCCRAEDFLIALPTGSIDLIVTSPPYDGIRSRAYNGVFNFELIAHQSYRVLKQGGVMVWVVGDQFTDDSETLTSFEQALYFKKSVGFKMHDTMIYMKAGPSYPSQDKYYQVFEYMFVLAKGKPATFNPIRDRENRWYGQKWSKVRTRRDKDGNLKRTVWYEDDGEQFGTRFNIWQYTVGAGYSTEDPMAHEHPAIFPDKLAEDHILTWSNPGDVVLDFFGGSGTTARQARKLNRRWMYCDISPVYTDLAQRMLNKPFTQNMFATLEAVSP